MHRFPILFLIISLSTLAMLSSCAGTDIVQGFAKAEVAEDTYTATYFSDAATDYVYKANISVYGNEFGGIVIIKKINNTMHRVAFTTEFGNKLFDFELTDTDFTVKYILEDLDRKVIVNTLKQDFMLLLKKKFKIDEQYLSEYFMVLSSKSSGNRYNYVFLNPQSKSLVKLVHATRTKEKVIFHYTPASPALAHKIVIDHKNINLNIELNYFNQ